MKALSYKLKPINKPLILILLGLVLLNFLGYGLYWCFLLIPITVYLYLFNLELLDENYFFILMFSVGYSLCIIINGNYPSSSLLLAYFTLPPVFYFLGKYLIKQYPGGSTVYFLLFYTCVLFSILPFLANIISIREDGFMTVRTIRLFWMDESDQMNATNIGSYFALNLTMIPLLFIRKVRSMKPYFLLSLFLILIGSISILNMGNRTGLVIMILSLLVFFIISANKITAGLFITIFVCVAIYLYSFDIFGIRTGLEYSTYYDRIVNTGLNEEGSRYVLWKKALSDFLSYPFGYVRNDVKINYAHNLWLDVVRVSGFIPLIPLLFFTISALINIARVVFNKKNEEFLRFLIAGFGVAFYITFLLEPIMEGFYIMFFVFCFYFGIVRGIREYL